MINLHNENEQEPFGLYQDENIFIDFCVWVLQIDGLQVPPFDKHSAGNGLLSAQGLNATVWSSWFANVVRTKEQASRETLGSFYRYSYSPEIWNGEPAVKELLQELWAEYLSMLKTTKIKWYIKIQFGEETQNSEKVFGLLNVWNDFNKWQRQLKIQKLYDNLQQYRQYLSILYVYQVHYPAPIEYLVPPASIVLSSANALPGSNTYCQSVLRATEKLIRI